MNKDGTTTHQFMSLGITPVDRVETDGSDDLLYYKPSRPGTSKPKSKKHRVPKSIPSMGCEQLEDGVDPLGTSRTLKSKNKERVARNNPDPCIGCEQVYSDSPGKPRPALSEITHHATRMSQIFRSERNQFQNREEGRDIESLEMIQGRDIEEPTETKFFDKSGRTEDTFNSNISSSWSLGFGEPDVDQHRPVETNPRKHLIFHKINNRFRAFRKELMRFKVLKIIQVLLAIYIAILTYADIGPPGGLQDTETGLIVDQQSTERTEKGLILVNGVARAIVGVTKFQVACIGISRLSAFFMYPGKVAIS
jgi:hypothetical protein